jgi:hypothetical protein
MVKNFKQEIITAAILLVLLVLLVNPFEFWMPSPAEMLLVVSLVVIFGIFSGLLWRERGGDEREQWHRMLADRFGYLAGALVLVVGILIESLRHDLNLWLVAALGAMILVRIIGFIYSQTKH